MLGITRYILKQLTVGMVFVTIALVCVLWLSQSLRMVELIVNKGLSVGMFLHLTILLMPNFLVIILPLSLFAVTLFTYNRLIADRELVVMRAVGMSPLALARPALILASATSLCGWVLAFWLVPISVQSFRELQWSIRNDVSSTMLQEGMFNQVSSGMTIYVRARDNDGELLGILVHDKRNPDKPVSMMAEKGVFLSGGAVPRVLMINGNRQEVDDAAGKLSILYFDTYAIDFGSREANPEDRYIDPRERSFSELLDPRLAKTDPNEFRRFRVEAHQRIAGPLYAPALALVALAALLTGGFNRRGQAGRLLSAVAVMVLTEAGGLGSANLATHRLDLIPLMYINAAVPAFIAAFMLLGPQLRKPRSVPVAAADPAGETA